MKQMKRISLVLSLCLALAGISAWGQAVGDYGSAASGNWTANATWVVCVTPGTWDGATPATTATTTTTNVWIRNGHTVVFDISSKNCNNLIVESGGKLWGNSANTTPKYLNINGTTITNNGVFGGATDALGLKPFNTSLTLTGSGSYGMSRIQPQVDGLTLVFDADALVTYAGSSGTGSSAIYNNGKDNLTVTVNAGKTLTTNSLAYITLATSGSGIPTNGLNFTLNINGTLVTGANGHINLLNASNKTSTINIGSTGVLISNGNLLMPDGTASTGILNIANGGSLNTSAATITTLGTSTLTSLAGTFGASGAVNVNGTFQLNDGGWATGTGVWKYGPTAVLEFNTNTFYGVNNDAVYWPVTDGPVNVNILLGGILLNTPRTVSGIFQTSGGVKNTFGNDLTVTGTVKLNTGGYFDNFSPSYTNTATLEYNTGGAYGNGNEWIDGSGAGYGVPQNVKLSNGTLVNLNSNKTIPGTLSLLAGKLALRSYNLSMINMNSILVGADPAVSGYIITDGTGSVNQPVLNDGTGLYPVGTSSSSYDPATLTPIAPVNMSVKVGTTLPADAPANYIYAAKVWDITAETPVSTVVNLTPSNPVTTAVSDVIAHYESGNYTNVAATRVGNTYTATFTSFSPFVTGTMDSGDKVSQTKIDGVYFDGKTIHNQAKLDLQVFDSAGRLMIKSNKDINMDSNPNGIYIVKSSNGTLKIALNK